MLSPAEALRSAVAVHEITPLALRHPLWRYFERLHTRPHSFLLDSAKQSNGLGEHTFLGASELLAVSDADPAELRRRVTSPKGTTERAIAVMSEADLGSMFDRATAAALARAKELALGG